MPHESIGAESNNEEVNEINDEIFQSEEDMTQDRARFCYGDLHIIDRLWIEAIKTALVDTKWSLIPVVYASKPGDSPQKPPPMKYTDLPLYKAPHYEYKDYLSDKDKCSKANVKLIHEYLLPYVKDFRKSTQDSYHEMSTEYRAIKKDLYNAITCKKKEFKNYMRDPDNLNLRQAVVALGGAAGYYIGSGKGVSRRIFSTSLGLLATGSLCFPKETDEKFRNFSYSVARIGVSLYNRMCGKHFSMRERLPCEDDMPPPSKKRKMNQCEKK